MQNPQEEQDLHARRNMSAFLMAYHRLGSRPQCATETRLGRAEQAGAEKGATFSQVLGVGSGQKKREGGEKEKREKKEGSER